MAEKNPKKSRKVPPKVNPTWPGTTPPSPSPVWPAGTARVDPIQTPPPVEPAPKQGFFNRAKTMAAGGAAGYNKVVDTVAEKAGGFASKLKGAGGLVGPAQVLASVGLEGADMLKVLKDPNHTIGDVAQQGASSAAGLAGGKVLYDVATRALASNPRTRLLAGLVAGTAGYMGGKALVPGAAEGLEKKRIEEEKLKAEAEAEKKNPYGKQYEALKKEFSDARAKGQDTTKILERARLLKSSMLGLDDALSQHEESLKIKSNPQGQAHPLMALFEQGMKNLQAPQLKQVEYKPQGAWAPMQHVAEGVENARAMSNYRKSLGASQKLMDQAVQVYGSDATVNSARAKLMNESMQSAFDRIGKENKFYVPKKDGGFEADGPSNSIHQNLARAQMIEAMGNGVTPSVPLAEGMLGATELSAKNAAAYNTVASPTRRLTNTEPHARNLRSSLDMGDIPRSGVSTWIRSKMPGMEAADVGEGGLRQPIIVSDVTEGDPNRRARLFQNTR